MNIKQQLAHKLIELKMAIAVADIELAEDLVIEAQNLADLVTC
jgi:hypothetical protein